MFDFLRQESNLNQTDLNYFRDLLFILFMRVYINFQEINDAFFKLSISRSLTFFDVNLFEFE
jgi:hypothetical protein